MTWVCQKNVLHKPKILLCAGPLHMSFILYMSTARHFNLLVDDRHNYIVKSWELWSWCSCFYVFVVTACSLHGFLCVCVLPVSHCCDRACVTAGSDAQHTNLFNSLGAWATDGGPLLLLDGPAPKTSSRAAAAVRTQTKPPFTSSTQLFIFRGIRGNTRQGLSDPNSRTSLLFYTQASSQLSLIFNNCFLSCLVE